MMHDSPRFPLLLVLAGLVACGEAGGSPSATGSHASALRGAETDADDPAVVLVMELETPASSIINSVCTGTVIAPRVVLTAAHCVRPRTALKLSLLPQHSGNGSEPGDIPVTDVYVDPEFDRMHAGHDIALLATDVDLGVTPAPLNREPLGKTLVGKEIRAVGYGLTSSDAGWPSQFVRRHTMITVVSAPGEFLDVEQAGKGICQGDSGGPSFMRRSDGSELLVAVHSFGLCEGRASETRVDFYLSRIDEFVAAHSPPAGPDAAASDAANAASPAPADVPTTTGGCALARGPAPRRAWPLGLIAAFSLWRRRRRARSLPM